MFLSDYLYAINYLAAALGSDMSICFTQVSCNVFGNSFIFAVDGSNERYIVWRGGLVEKVYNDTWRNSDHKEIIKKGNGEEVW